MRGGVEPAEPAAPYLPFAIDEVEIIRPLSQSCYAYVERDGSGKPARGDLRKFTITLVNEGGEVLVRIRDFYVRAYGAAGIGRHNAAAADKGDYVTIQ